MVRVTIGASFAVRCAASVLFLGAFALVSADHAEARRHSHHRSHRSLSQRNTYSPPYAAIVMDANSGAVLHESNADSLRHPASLTKIMTLYLLFERLEQGKITLDTPLSVSAHAASMAPSKLGLRPGQSIRVEDAIRAVVTKSANDIAVVIAEGLGGDEDSFAEMMTNKARALGMSRTTYVNASGLPDDEQITTARDQAMLGRAIQERFPQYYRYFSTPSFTYRGQWMRNHNHLLGSVEGVDGIKTGYTQASGFNLVTSVRRGNRHIVAVVLGGRSAGARDARMRELINANIVIAATRKTATPLVDVADNRPATPEKSKPSFELASASNTVVQLPKQNAAPPIAVPRQDAAALADKSKAAARTSDSLEPIRVKTVKVKGNFTKMAMTGSVAPQSLVNQADEAIAAPVTTAQVAPAVVPKDEIQARFAAIESSPLPETAPAVTKQEPTDKPAPVKIDVAKVEKPAPVKTDAPATHAGWVIQVGAFPALSEAQQRLVSVKSKNPDVLGRADPFTEPVVKGSQTLYRARFAGFDRDTAEAACRHLKRSDVSCLTVRN
jgi:D-alanyl-D-alanine carboxypeptidase